MHGQLHARFVSLWRRINASTDPSPIANELLARWSEPWRHYHSSAHLESCLIQFDTHLASAQEPDAVELAIWFHDAVYDPRASDNEAQSAALANATLRAAALPSPVIAKVEHLVLATRVHQPDGDPDTALFLDLDLSILGAQSDAYEAYSAAIRREFEWVYEPDYRAKRAAILTRFLQRPRIFLTKPFFNRSETSARTNLTLEIQRLSTS